MSYAMSLTLQAAVYAALSGDAELAAMVGGAVYDAVPEGAPDLYVALGPERVRGAGDATGPAAEHRFRIGVVTARDGYADAKAVAARVAAVLEAGLAPASGRVVGPRLVLAEARRDRRDGTRRVDLTFRARTEP